MDKPITYEIDSEDIVTESGSLCRFHKVITYIGGRGLVLAGCYQIRPMKSAG